MAIPTNNNKTAKRVFKPVLSTDSPYFCPTWTPTIEPKTNINTKIKSIEP